MMTGPKPAMLLEVEDMVMRTLDFSPLFRSSVGFDRMSRLMESASRTDGINHAYPPYNIEKTDEDRYRISMAVAGFSEDEIEITAEESVLTIAGKAREDEEDAKYLHRGIARRAFERRFDLAEHITATDARLANGLLHVDLVREVPEERKPRRIAIEAADGTDRKAA